MIGKQIFKISLQPNIGDREDFSVRIIGPGETDYTFPLALTRTILAIWQEDNPKNAAEFLVKNIFDVIGTASAPPEEGFWFDSYNSAKTLRETANSIRNKGIQSFTKVRLENSFVQLIGADLFKQKKHLDDFFVNKYGFEFFRSFDDAFEDSQAIEDLSTPAKDNAHFLYRVCILSGFIDHINVRLPKENKQNKSLKAFKNWLLNEVKEDKLEKLTRTFQMVKNLRKQYPIHEHFDISPEGIRQIRREISEARKYFNLTLDYERDWLNVFEVFKKSLISIEEELKN
ncbi:MAG: hypothetical protein UV71_C0015G0023 [Microgenomates group bacterium GW2011_GWC1_43_13]|nr:MAG: hypothetical protein UV71_C0015G0023 [Microgenomates group bacterium GW2011_GWC1_43_13]